MRSSVAVLTLLIGWAAMAEPLVVDDLGIMSLNVDVAQYKATYNYPNTDFFSQPLENSPADCLILVTSMSLFDERRELLSVLVDQIEVMDGIHEVGVLPPQYTDRNWQHRHIFYSVAANRGDFQTDLHLRTKSGETLGQVVRNVLGENVFVGIQVSRQCMALN